MPVDEPKVPDPVERADALAAESLRAGDPTGWFETIYGQAARGEVAIPWDRGTAHPLVAAWLREQAVDGTGRRAVVVGCGFGSDADLLASAGFDTTAFDISPSAIAGARARFPDSPVSFTAADLFDLPARWHHRFDLVLEVITVQALPRADRSRAFAAIRDLVAPGGTLLFVGGALPDGADLGGLPPYRFTQSEVDAIAGDELTRLELDQRLVGERRYWRGVLRRD